MNIVDRMVQGNLLQKKDLDRILSAGHLREPAHLLVVRTGLVAEEEYVRLLEDILGRAQVETLPEEYKPEQFAELSALFLEEHLFTPLELHQQELTGAAFDPFDHVLLDTLKKLYPGRRIRLVPCRQDRIRNWIKQYFDNGAGVAGHLAQETEPDISNLQILEDLEHLRDLASEAPVIRKVNEIMTGAVESKASDIHFEPCEDRLRVRFRVDGILREVQVLPAYMHQAMTTRVKIMARLDIAERRIPQDGRIRTRVAGKNIDLRVSTLPTMFGEGVVMRILDRDSITFSLQSLGFPQRELSLFRDIIHSPYGIILVTGPTGSGKTTTLYAALNTINSIEKKIITIEDPVEYELDGINQMQVNPKAGLTFASGLRSIVRQDPDVILIGEIRDKETADIAIQSALTGHLVFSSLHTNDAAGALTRLMEIGVEDYLLSSSIIGIMAQRLVRILCDSCKKPFLPDELLVKRYGLALPPGNNLTLHQPLGCPKCSHSGYRERTAIFELMVITDEIRELLLQNKSTVSIREMGRKQGMRLLREDGFAKVAEGRTSVEEVLRVTGQ